MTRRPLPLADVRADDGRRRLRADCSRCVGLCCVAPAFAASADFALYKPAGTPCPSLQADDRCGIHDRLRDHGFPGCTVFDCFGAGQQLTQHTFGGRSRRESPDVAGGMFATFPVMCQLHEVLWYLAEAATRVEAASLHGEIEDTRRRTEQLAAGTAEELTALDVGAFRAEVGTLLDRVSERVRARTTTRGQSARAPTSSAPTCAASTSGRRTCSAPTCGTPTCAAPT